MIRLVLLSLLILLTLVPESQAQLFPFGRRHRPYCPDCNPNSPYDPNSPSLPNPDAVKPNEPPADLAEYEKIIPKEIRIRNKNGNCVWCALEDVFVAAGFDEVKGVTAQAIKEGWSGAGISNVESFLKKAKIHDNAKIVKNHDYSIFDFAKQEGVGVYIEIRGSTPREGHAIAVVGLDEKNAYIVDNNPPLTVQRRSREWLHNKWEGVACCPLFHKHKPKPDAPSPTVQPGVGPAGPQGPAGPPGKDGAGVDLGPLTAKVDGIAGNVNKLADSVAKLQTSVGGMNSNLVVLDQRISALEQRPIANPPNSNGNNPAPVPPVRYRIIPENPTPQ